MNDSQVFALVIFGVVFTLVFVAWMGERFLPRRPEASPPPLPKEDSARTAPLFTSSHASTYAPPAPVPMPYSAVKRLILLEREQAAREYVWSMDELKSHPLYLAHKEWEQAFRQELGDDKRYFQTIIKLHDRIRGAHRRRARLLLMRDPRLVLAGLLFEMTEEFKQGGMDEKLAREAFQRYVTARRS